MLKYPLKQWLCAHIDHEAVPFMPNRVYPVASEAISFVLGLHDVLFYDHHPIASQ